MLPTKLWKSNYVKASRRPLCTHLCDHYALLITLPSRRQEVVDEEGEASRGDGKGDGQCPHHKLRLKLRAAAKSPRSMFSRGVKIKLHMWRSLLYTCLSRKQISPRNGLELSVHNLRSNIKLDMHGLCRRQKTV